MKELVYTGIFVGLGILLIVLLFVMFYPRKKSHPMPPPMLQPKRHRMFPVSTIQS